MMRVSRLSRASARIWSRASTWPDAQICLMFGEIGRWKLEGAAELPRPRQQVWRTYLQ